MLNKLQSLFVSISEKVENNPTPISQYFFLFGAILSVRLALEFFSSQRLFTMEDIIHIGLWFTFIVLAFLLQLHFFSGENIVKIAKLVITFFTIALTAPILDLILTQGIGAKMNYLSIHSLRDVCFSYLTLGGGSLRRGATLGIRIEIVLLVIACFNYIRTKRNSLIWGFLGAWCVYTVLFISGTIPSILGQIVQFFQLQYETNDQSTLLMLLSIDLFLLMLIFFRYNATKLRTITQNVPWASMLLAFLHFLIGVAWAVKNYPDNWKLNPTSLFWFPLLLGIFLCMCMLLGIYRLNSPTSYLKISKGILALLLIMCGMIGFKSLFLIAVIWGLLFLLNDTTLLLKQFPILRNSMEAMLLLATSLFGFCSFGAPMIGFPSNWLIIIFIATTMGGFFTEITRSNNIIFDYNKWSAQTQKRFHWLCILLLALAYLITETFLIADKNLKQIFYFVALASLLFLYYKPSKTQTIIFTCLPAYIILLMYILR